MYDDLPDQSCLSQETENLFKEAEKSRLEVKAHLIGLDHLILAVTNQRKVIELLQPRVLWLAFVSEIKQIQARRKERDARPCNLPLKNLHRSNRINNTTKDFCSKPLLVIS